MDSYLMRSARVERYIKNTVAVIKHFFNAVFGNCALSVSTYLALDISLGNSLYRCIYNSLARRGNTRYKR